jgi:hypothetical protein
LICCPKLLPGLLRIYLHQNSEHVIHKNDVHQSILGIHTRVLSYCFR